MARADVDREPPHSEDVERAVLGSILLDNSLIVQARKQLAPEDFHRPRHRIVFKAMLALDDAGAAIDPVLIADHLRSEGQLETVGDTVTIYELTYGIPHGHDLGRYVRVLREKTKMRRALDLMAELEEQVLAGEDLRLVHDAALRGLGGLSTEDEEAAGLALSWAEFSASARPRAEEVLFGLERGEVGMIVAATNVGKSTLSLNLALVLCGGGRLPPLVPEAAAPRTPRGRRNAARSAQAGRYAHG